MSDVVVEPVLRVSDAALSKILDLKAAEDDPEGVGLRVGVTGVHNGEFTYELSFEPLAEAADDDRRVPPGRPPGHRARRLDRRPRRGHARPARPPPARAGS